MADVEQVASVPVIAVTAAVGAVVLLFVLVCGVGRKEEDHKSESEIESNGASSVPAPTKKTTSSNKRGKIGSKKDAKHTFTHPWLASTLKGHSGLVLGLDFSPNGKLLATCSEDRTVLIWNTKDLTAREHKSVRGNVELDHATQVKFSPDNRAFLVNLYNENTIRVMKIGKKPDGSMGNIQGVLDFPKIHEEEIINIGISVTGKFIMTASKGTQIKVWDLKGEVLATIDTLQMSNSYAAVSSCGRFIASCGFTPDVKIWEVSFDKADNFREVSRAFELKGHSAGVYSFDFSEGSTRMATVSKDGTWKLWDTNIEYQKGQDPYLLVTGQCKDSRQSLISISPDSITIAIATHSNLYVYDATTGNCTQEIINIFSGLITAVSFDNNSQCIICAGDKHVCCFHNVTGLKSKIVDLLEKKKKASNSAYKDRVQEQIDQTNSLLKSIVMKDT